MEAFFGQLASAGAGVLNHVQDNITRGVINDKQIELAKYKQQKDLEYDRWKTTSGRDFSIGFLSAQNDAALQFRRGLSKDYEKMGLPPVLAYGGFNQLNGIQYQSGLNVSRVNQPGFNGNNLLGFSKPVGF